MFCTVIVNTLLIAGIFVSSSRRSSESKVVSPSPEADTTNVPSAEYSAKERSIILQRGGGGGGRGYSHTLPLRVCAVQRDRDFEAPDLERGIHFRGVLQNRV